MKNLKRIFTLILAASLTQPAFAAEEQSKEVALNPVIEKIDVFVKEFTSSDFGLALTDKQILDLLDHNDIHLIIRNGVVKASVMSEGPDFDAGRLEWSELMSKQRKKARRIVTEMFDLPMEDINLTMLSLLHRYLFDDKARGAVVLILNEIVAHRFDTEALNKIAKENSWQMQYARGSIVTILLASVAALWGGKRMFTAKTWTLLKSGISKSTSKTAAPVAGRIESATANNQSLTVDQLIKLIDQSGLATNVGVQAAKETTKEVVKASAGQTIGMLGKIRAYSKFSNLLSPVGFKSMFYLTGVAATGGAANVGLQALIKKLNPENFENSAIDFNLLRDEYYDSLAAVRLTCLSHDLLTSAQQVKSVVPLNSWVAKINIIHSELELMKRINPRFIDISSLPNDVKLNQETGTISFLRTAHGRAVTEEFECAKLKTNPSAVANFSLNQVMSDIVKIAEHFGQLRKDQDDADDKIIQEARAKAAADAKALVDAKNNSAGKDIKSLPGLPADMNGESLTVQPTPTTWNK